jgi:hypothetical protein
MFCRDLLSSNLRVEQRFSLLLKTIQKFVALYNPCYILYSGGPEFDWYVWRVPALCFWLTAIKNQELQNIKFHMGGEYKHKCVLYAVALTHRATSLKTVGSIPDEVIGIFH